MTLRLATVRSDTLPENTRYSDDGCEVSPSCLTCPLPMCKYDDPGWLRRSDRRSRDREIFMLRQQGVPVRELSARFAVSTRTVHRIVQRGDPPAGPEPEEDEGPRMTLQELAESSLYRRRTPFPSMLREYAKSA